MATQHHFYADNLVDVLLEVGIPTSQILELDGWKTNQQGYYWTDEDDRHDGYDGIANAHLNHHTASSAYTPYVKNEKGQTKCNVWGGLLRGSRLYQTGGGVPTLAIASAGPANYSAGSGVEALLQNFIVPRLRYIGKQTRSDDNPKWYGNRAYWNTEWVLDGTGGRLANDVWDLLIAYNEALSRLHDYPAWFNYGHGHHTRRKIDLRDGRFPNMADTIYAIQELVKGRLDMNTDPNCPWSDKDYQSKSYAYPPCDSHYFPPSNYPVGIDSGQNQGTCHMPKKDGQPTQAAGVDWNFQVRRWILGNTNRYDYDRPLSEGREGIMTHRGET